ncbi:Histidine kinase-, DNA gyrase B-, and HSP90-like ATPase [Anaerocolumna jejuensis DSM 15929]|uniref:Histidine kinase-, DNA gyrase B-, and HSP90-like ATPase n=1 Tax=Anaerocolumna jejuensis DSM 15929 TaxID=1121322 RepID=A0A1M6KW32_9FIRM|nr:histidine kinase [Anaerocolumna jejuensis]SHJ63139.1 Histidine kinase-, DNA gyrase B-, and HSP90-like ATPase [Anaerocolumna jejuensis DSM 15929]
MSFWNKLNLKQKILTVFIPLIVLSILLILTVSVSVIARSSRKETIQNAIDKCTLVGKQAELIISNTTYNIKAFSTSSTLQESIRADYTKDTYGSYLFYSAMHTSVYNIMDIENLISSGYVQTFDNRIYDIKTDKVSYAPDNYMQKEYHYITSMGGQILIRPATDKSVKSAYNISKTLIDIKTGNCLGILSFNIKESLFYQSYSNISDSQEEEFLITDGSGKIISAKNRSLPGKTISSDMLHLIGESKTASRELVYEREKKMAVSVPVGETGYHVICLIPYKSIYQNALELVRILLIIGVLVLITTFFLARFLAESLVWPLQKLTSFAGKVGEGSLDISIELNSSDEIGLLARQFQKMVQNIKQLTQQIYTEQNNKREYELRLLQSQINPHFLYNCLDNITTLIEAGENSTAVNMIHHLGRYYRFILSKGRNIITIKEEIQIVKDYLEIQLIKKPGLFTYDIQAEDTVKDYKILKFLLQPIVENSVIHGFSNCEYNGCIGVSFHVNEKDDIVITIEDNGQGIPQKTLEQIFIPSEVSIPKHFGLSNINERIRLKFGEAYGLTIMPKETGTVITLTFPKML